MTRTAVHLPMAVTLAITGCIRDPGVQVFQNDSGLLDVHVSFRAKGSCLVRLGDMAQESTEGEDGWHRERFRMPARSLPIGLQELTAEVKCGARTARATGSFKRRRVEPKLEIIGVGSSPADFYRTFQCGGDFCSGSELVVQTDGKVRVRMALPVGASGTVDGQTVTSTLAVDGRPGCGRSTEMPELHIDLNHHVPALPLAGLVGDPPTAELRLRAGVVADGERWGVLPIPARALAVAVAGALEAVAKGPVVFEGDTPAPPRPRTLIEIRDGTVDGFFGGPATVNSLDLVAVTKARPQRRVARCGPYTSEAGSKPFFWDVSAGDEEATVYDRRTGRIVAHRVFSASYACPDFYRAPAGHEILSPSDTKNEPAHAKAHEWFARLVRQ
jgi:hypothetical protein